MYLIKIEKMIEAVYNFLDGKFGNRVLKRPYRKLWRTLTWGTLVYGIFAYVLFPLMELWQAVVNYINYVRWGIE